MSDLYRINIPHPDHFNTYRDSRGSMSSTESSTNSPISPMSPAENGNWDTVESHKRPTKRGVSTFINKLFSMVNDKRYQHLISWNASGRSFLVCNATRFAQEILPENFKHSNFSSFVRQLNMYGFHKINKSPRGQRGNNKNEIWEFSHSNFQRGRADLLEEIKRKSMDSELLRRETGDIHASFAMVQLSHADLLQHFHVLQENFANLLQSFEDTKKTQLQQQIIIKKLAEREGIPVTSLFNEYENNNEQPGLTVTSPYASVRKPLQHEMMDSSLNGQDHGFNFSMGVHSTLLPSPVSSVNLPYYNQDKQDQDKRMTQQQLISMGFSNQ
ncbi:HSF-type DNA-binding-domain-containing protein [Helicostylum pulchrum]|nr:HSF-type DNA-binding-domain-containing protein [Helicostylum pulchrum]